MLSAAGLRRSRKEPRQAGWRWSCTPSGFATLPWSRAAFPPCCAHRSRCMAPLLPISQPDTVSSRRSVELELNNSSWPIGAPPAPTCDFSVSTNILPTSMSLSIMSAAWLISWGFARAAGYHWSMRHDSRPRYASLSWPERRSILLRDNPVCRRSPRQLPCPCLRAWLGSAMVSSSAAISRRSGETRLAQAISAKLCRLFSRPARRNSRGSQPSSRTGIPGRSTFPENTISKLLREIYKCNELARGNLVALGQKIDLSRLRLPIYVLAGSADNVVAPEQLLAVERLVGTRPESSSPRGRPVRSSQSVHGDGGRLKSTGPGSCAG